MKEQQEAAKVESSAQAMKPVKELTKNEQTGQMEGSVTVPMSKDGGYDVSLVTNGSVAKVDTSKGPTEAKTEQGALTVKMNGDSAEIHMGLNAKSQAESGPATLVISTK